MTRGRIFEIKRFAVHDGPGIRTTVFFKGCPLKCEWCHNPEGIAATPEIALLERKCVHCGACLAACPHGLHSVDSNGAHLIDRERCASCNACVNACMPGALRRYGTDCTAEELLQAVSADADFFTQSGGGVTCSGGEPLMQADFAAGFLKLCKQAGLHTAVDTSGYAPRASLEKILPHTDLLLYDIKHMDTDAHYRATGVHNKLILDNLTAASEQGIPVEIRMPVIPGYNDSDENLRQTARYLRGVKTLTLVRPLPYHALSGSKYDSIGKTHNMPAASGEEYEAARRAASLFETEGLPCKSPD